MRLGKGTWEDKILRENLELLFNEAEQEEYMLAELNLRPVGFKTLHLSWSDRIQIRKDEFGNDPSVSPHADISLINTLRIVTVLQFQPQKQSRIF